MQEHEETKRFAVNVAIHGTVSVEAEDGEGALDEAWEHAKLLLQRAGGTLLENFDKTNIDVDLFEDLSGQHGEDEYDGCRWIDGGEQCVPGTGEPSEPEIHNAGSQPAKVPDGYEPNGDCPYCGERVCAEREKQWYGYDTLHIVRECQYCGRHWVEIWTVAECQIPAADDAKGEKDMEYLWWHPEDLA